jgi:hypothetical protein
MGATFEGITPLLAHGIGLGVVGVVYAMPGFGVYRTFEIESRRRGTHEAF